MLQGNGSKTMRSVTEAAKLWRIWLKLGLQDLRIRYRRSVIGVGWIFLNMAVLLIAVGLIYSNLLGQDMRTFLPFLTIGLILWGYFTSSVVEGGNAFVNSEGYIKQIGLPIYVYIFRYFVSITVTMLINIPTFFLVAIFYSMNLRLGALWALPGLLLVSIVALLLVVIFSHLNARFRDSGHLAGIGLQIMFFVTPVIWPPESIRSGEIKWIVEFNPFFHLLEIVRYPLLNSKPAECLNYVVVLIIIGTLALWAWYLIKKFSGRIAFLL
jgi:lipopolysaccharide transport system permease protein